MALLNSEWYIDPNGLSYPVSVEFNSKSDISSDLLKITTEYEAKKYLDDYTEFIRFTNENTKSRDDARNIAKGNIGYLAGYLTEKDRARIEELFGVEHPILGSIAEMGIPTADESFQCGLQGITLKQLRVNNIINKM